MTLYSIGALDSVPISDRPDLVAPTVLAALQAAGLVDTVGVVPVDPALSDTAATQEAYDLAIETLANCVVVGGKRDGEERVAACLVLASTRADVNGTVKRRLDVRKASFLSREVAVERTGMEFGAITPVGMPDGWPVLVDAAVVATPLIVIGSGIRAAKLVLRGADLAALSGVEVVEGLGA